MYKHVYFTTSMLNSYIHICTVKGTSLFKNMFCFNRITRKTLKWGFCSKMIC